MRYVLDADILIGALDGSDAHHRQARRLFVAWREQDDAVLVSVVNLSEVLVAPAADRKRLRVAREALAALGVSVHLPSEAVGVDASRLRSRHPVSLPDGYLLATAKHTGATAVSFDRKVVRAAKAAGIPASLGGSAR
ncbi:MAG TPA: PIN domain-containing protein [Solirubrobacteraceae bacterium]